eukprot:7711892-Lingulodinium_polyedra.AAC.1
MTARTATARAGNPAQHVKRQWQQFWQRFQGQQRSGLQHRLILGGGGWPKPRAEWATVAT